MTGFLLVLSALWVVTAWSPVPCWSATASRAPVASPSLLEAFSLEQCYQAALTRSEALASSSELIVQAEERYSQAWGGIIPRADLVGSYTRLDTPPSTSQSAFTRPDRPEVRVAFSQALFRGFREYSTLKARGLDAQAALEARRQAATQLYTDTATAFYLVLSLEQDLKNLSTQFDLTKRRVNELNERRRIGRSRPSEVLAVQASVANIEAQIAQVKAQLSANREALSFFTGLSADARLRDEEPLSAKLPRLDHYLDRIEQRPDVARTSKLVIRGEEDLKSAKGAHLPSIDLTANYYLKRVGVLENQKWDFTVAATLPLFAGGVIQSAVREAASRGRQAELDLSSARRQGQQQIKVTYENLVADRAQFDSLGRAFELSEKNYYEQTREYRYGLVTNLEVLQALTNFQETKRAYDRALFQAKLDLIRLEAASALRPLAPARQN